MARFANSVLFNPASGGTGDFVVSAAVVGYMTPSLAGMPSGVYKYRAESNDLSQWEIGEGTYTSGTTTLTRTTVLYNSSGTGTATGQSGAGTKINFTVPPNVGIVQAVEDTLGVDQSNAWTYLQKAQARANVDALKKNYILNGGAQISQELGTAATVVSGTYPVDQFAMLFSNAGTQTGQQVASVTPGNSPNRIRITATVADASVAAGDFLLIRQKIEGTRTADLRLGTASAKTITIQFGVKAPAGTYGVAIRNSAGNRNYVGEYVISGGEANTDVVKSVVIALDQSGTWLTDTGVGLEITWWLMAGTTYHTTVNTWNGTNNAFATASQFNLMGTISNVFELFDVSLTEGSVAPAFILPEFDRELIKCMRYFEKSYDYPTAIANATLTGSHGWFVNGLSSSTAAGFVVNYTVRKRVTPSITLYSPNTGASGVVFDAQGSLDRVPAQLDFISERSFRVGISTGAQAGQSFYTHFKADARM